MKKIGISIGILLLITFFVACNPTTNNSTPSQTSVPSQPKVAKEKNILADYDVERGVMKVGVKDNLQHNYQVSINDNIIEEGFMQQIRSFDILYILRNHPESSMWFAMSSAKSNNEFDVNIKVSNLLDTTFSYRLIPIVSEKENNIGFTGPGAKIIKKSEGRNIDEEIKRWLYRQHIVLDDSIYEKVRMNYSYLTETEDNEYITQQKVPVVHSLKNVQYNVTCEMTADYYAVVACQFQNFIDNFVEDAYVKNYSNVSKTKSALECHYPDISTGYLCIFLLGINKDLSYKQLPLGIIALDNSAPYDQKFIATTSVKCFSFRNETKIIVPEDAPQLEGAANVAITHWDGNGLECFVTFEVVFADDCKSVTISRRGELCGPNPFGGPYLKPEDKVIYAVDNVKQTFTWKLHFNDGDNEIPYTLEDYHGNKSSYKLVERAVPLRSNSPQIDIDNTIYN